MRQGLGIEARGARQARKVNAAQPTSRPVSDDRHLYFGHVDKGDMDASLASKVFQRLLSHQTCSRLRFYPSSSGRLHSNSLGRRHYRRSQDNDGDDDSKGMSSWQMRTDMFPPDKLREYERYPMVTSDMLRSRKERPQRVKMLTRDFIDGSFLHCHTSGLC